MYLKILAPPMKDFGNNRPTWKNPKSGFKKTLPSTQEAYKINKRTLTIG
jgi:hypothetical protein